MVILTETTDYKYDVFLSFRGADTRLSFTDHLHVALKSANLATFYDDEEIDTGLDLKPELESAIRASRASIIVLSKDYASSTWCLNELVLILEQLRNSNQIVIPIFYHVEPTDVRKQQSTFGDSMAKHGRKMDAESDAEKKSQWERNISRWKEALTEVANLKGQDAKNWRETELIQEIVYGVHRRLGSPIKRTLPLLVGMDYSTEFITSWLKSESSDCADILTILGMGGIGKTSLARYVYELHRYEFESSSFVEDISRKCLDSSKVLLRFQKQLFCDILRKKDPLPGDHVSEYTSNVENALSRKIVLLVLDDIDSLDQLDALLGKKGFHPGSKIIITTKDESLTERCAVFNQQVQPKHTKHILKGLHESASLELLCLHAFKCENCKEGYEEVSSNIVKYCQGHPLALEVLGRLLYDRHVGFWEKILKELKQEHGSRVTNVLEKSFDNLPSENDKELFKHIACFFVGMEREMTENILDECDIMCTRYGILNLTERCLLSIGWNNTLVMHQLVQEMGRGVVHKESKQKPWKRSRLWSHDESYEVLRKGKGKGNLLGLSLDMRMLQKKNLQGSNELDTMSLNKMERLVILHLDYVQIIGSYKNFPEELRWLCMRGFPSKSIPSDLPMKNLVALDMSHSKIESFGMSFSNPQPTEGKKMQFSRSCSRAERLLGSLKILNLSFSEQLRSLGGFCEFPSLVSLFLENCSSLIEVCESIGKCEELIHVDLSNCKRLNKLLQITMKLNKVETLKLGGCGLNANNTDINSEASSSAIVDAIPRDLTSLGMLSSLVRFVYDDENMEGGDPLSYYKSWNHIIGGDLSVFQLTTGAYLLHNKYFRWYTSDFFAGDHPLITGDVDFIEEEVHFKAFSQKKSN